MNRRLAMLLWVLLIFPFISSSAQQQRYVRLWLTTADQSSLFALQTLPLQFSESRNALPVVDVNDMEQYQPIDGFGLALTGGSAQLLMRMEPAPRNSLLKELFTTQGNDIGISYLRVSIGASDMNDHVFSYDDRPAGENDVDLAKFSMAPDRTDVIPVLKEILAIDPRIKILGSPWSAPAWMKTNEKSKGGN
jgi:glucosylceramidase